MPENNPPLSTRAVRGGLWITVSSCWVFGFGFAANIVLTRILPTDASGGFALAMFFAQLLRLQPKLGLGFAFAQHQGTTGQSLGTYFFMESLAAPRPQSPHHARQGSCFSPPGNHGGYPARSNAHALPRMLCPRCRRYVFNPGHDHRRLRYGGCAGGRCPLRPLAPGAGEGVR